MRPIAAAMHALRRRDDGATMVEYALMLALIAMVCVGTVTALGVSTDGVFGGPVLGAL